MRALLAFTALLIFGVIGYAIFEDTGSAHGPSDTNEAGKAQDREDSGAASIEPANDWKLSDSSALVDKTITDKERAGWTKFRPVVERFVPDPDGIGACPPAHFGARSSHVVRRYIRWNGFHIWQHEDGSETWLHYMPATKDPKTGETIAKPMLSTVVPSKGLPIADEESGGR